MVHDEKKVGNFDSDEDSFNVDISSSLNIPRQEKPDESWQHFVAPFLDSFKTSQTRKDIIFLSAFAILATLFAYFLGDFINLENILGIALSAAGLIILEIVSIIQLRKTLLYAFKKYGSVPFGFEMALLMATVFIPNILSAIILLLFALIEGGEDYVAGSLISLIFVAAVYLNYAFWIFAWKRLKLRKKDE